MPSSLRPIPGLARQPYEALGTAVRRIRETAGLTQESVEAESTIHVTHIRAIESGRRNPSVQTLWRLAAGLRVPFSTLCAEVEAEVSAANASENRDPE